MSRTRREINDFIKTMLAVRKMYGDMELNQLRIQYYKMLNRHREYGFERTRMLHGRQDEAYNEVKQGMDGAKANAMAKYGGGEVDFNNKKQLEAYIRHAAEKRGIDPDIAVRVSKSEGFNTYRSQVVKNGKQEPSYGPFQLYTGGGLGNRFMKDTGLDPRDPKTVKQQVDYALDEVKRDGWRQWYGAKKVGVNRWDGINRGTKTASTVADKTSGDDYADLPAQGAGETQGAALPDDVRQAFMADKQSRGISERDQIRSAVQASGSKLRGRGALDTPHPAAASDPSEGAFPVKEEAVPYKVGADADPSIGADGDPRWFPKREQVTPRVTTSALPVDDAGIGDDNGVPGADTGYEPAIDDNAPPSAFDKYVPKQAAAPVKKKPAAAVGEPTQLAGGANKLNWGTDETGYDSEGNFGGSNAAFFAADKANMANNDSQWEDWESEYGDFTDDTFTAYADGGYVQPAVPEDPNMEPDPEPYGGESADFFRNDPYRPGAVNDAPMAAPSQEEAAQAPPLPPVGEVVGQGLKYLQSVFGLSPNGSTPSPEKTQKMFAGAGRIDEKEMEAVRNTIDPKKQLPRDMADLAAMQWMYSHLQAKGNARGAAQVAAAMLQRSQYIASNYGDMAAKMVKEGNMTGAIKALKMAHDAIPDGKTLQAKGDTAALVDRQTNKVEQQFKVTPELVLSAALGLRGGGMYKLLLNQVTSRSGVAGDGTDFEDQKAKAAERARLTQQRAASRSSRPGKFDPASWDKQVSALGKDYDALIATPKEGSTNPAYSETDNPTRSPMSRFVAGLPSDGHRTQFRQNTMQTALDIGKANGYTGPNERLLRLSMALNASLDPQKLDDLTAFAPGTKMQVRYPTKEQPNGAVMFDGEVFAVPQSTLLRIMKVRQSYAQMYIAAQKRKELMKKHAEAASKQKTNYNDPMYEEASP